MVGHQRLSIPAVNELTQKNKTVTRYFSTVPVLGFFFFHELFGGFYRQSSEGEGSPSVVKVGSSHFTE